MTSLSQDFSRLTYTDEQGLRICPCVELIAFTDARLSDGPHAGLLNFYEAFRRRFGAQIKWYRTNTDDHFKKIKPAKLDMVPFWFQDARNKAEGLLGVELKTGDQPREMRVPSFEFNCDQLLDQPSGVFHMALPLGAGFETSAGMLPLITEALRDFPLASGYVGYTVYWDTLDFRFEKAFFNQHMPRIYVRHPGIGMAEPTYLYPMAIDGGVLGVSWMTMLGPKVLSQVGGLGRLVSELPAPIKVQPLDCKGGGALITAGPKPLVGDMDEGDDLPLYKAVGRAVRQARFPRNFYASGFDNDAAQQWFLRFFGDQ